MGFVAEPPRQGMASKRLSMRPIGEDGKISVSGDSDFSGPFGDDSGCWDGGKGRSFQFWFVRDGKSLQFGLEGLFDEARIAGGEGVLGGQAADKPNAPDRRVRPGPPSQLLTHGGRRLGIKCRAWPI